MKCLYCDGLANKFGFRSGIQRFRCRICGRTFSDNKRHKHVSSVAKVNKLPFEFVWQFTAMLSPLVAKCKWKGCPFPVSVDGECRIHEHFCDVPSWMYYHDLAWVDLFGDKESGVAPLLEIRNLNEVQEDKTVFIYDGMFSRQGHGLSLRPAPGKRRRPRMVYRGDEKEVTREEIESRNGWRVRDGM